MLTEMSSVIPVVFLGNLMLTNTCWTPQLTVLAHRFLLTFRRTNGLIQPRPVSHRLPGACLRPRRHLRLAQLRARLTSSLCTVLLMPPLRTFGRPLILLDLALRLLPVAIALAPTPPACRTSTARCLMSSELLVAVPDLQRSSRAWWKMDQHSSREECWSIRPVTVLLFSLVLCFLVFSLPGFSCVDVWRHPPGLLRKPLSPLFPVLLS
jgi:hypothetical protein